MQFLSRRETYKNYKAAALNNNALINNSGISYQSRMEPRGPSDVRRMALH